jgi:hypothetical protein
VSSLSLERIGAQRRHYITFDFTGLIESSVAEWDMSKIKPTRRIRLQPLETGQIWRMAELNLRVGMVGKLLVHYKLAKPDAIRSSNSCSGITTVEKYLKKNKAVLVSA